MSSRTVAVESLGLAACFYNDWHVYLDDPKYTFPASNPTDSLFTLMERVCCDPVFDGYKHRGPENMEAVLSDKAQAAAVLEYWNSWHLKNLKDQFAESQKLAVALLVATHPLEGVPNDKFDFFIVHLLTTSHTLRVLLPLLPSKWHISLLRQWWLLTLLVYIAQGRPKINIDNIKLVELEGRDWKWVTHRALKSEHQTDAHYVKALRSIQEASKTWSDPNHFFLRAAVKFGEDFDGWGGFDTIDDELQMGQYA
nr:hypothetical protein CFP56_10054 [Quercus suber]